MYPFKSLFLYPLGKYLVVQLLDYTVVLSLTFWGSSILFSTVTAPVCIPTRVREGAFSSTSLPRGSVWTSLEELCLGAVGCRLPWLMKGDVRTGHVLQNTRLWLLERLWDAQQTARKSRQRTKKKSLEIQAHSVPIPIPPRRGHRDSTQTGLPEYRHGRPLPQKAGWKIKKPTTQGTWVA